MKGTTVVLLGGLTRDRPSDDFAVLELDGGQRTAKIDSARQTWLEQRGHRILRVWNNDVTGNRVGVPSTSATTLSRTET